MRLARIGILLALMGAASIDAAAQEIAGSFDQLRVLIGPGDRIRVTTQSGDEIRGRVVELLPASVTLVVDDTPRNFAETEISTIRQRRSDSLRNGALWGFGIGAGLGLFGGVAVASSDGGSAVLIPLVSLMYAGLGAGIGVGVDAMISGEAVIYARHIPTSRIRLSPIVARDTLSVAITVSWE